MGSQSEAAMELAREQTEAIVQENINLKNKVESLVKMLKKDRLRIKKLEAEAYEHSVDKEIEKELRQVQPESRKERSYVFEAKKIKQEVHHEELLVEDEGPEKEKETMQTEKSPAVSVESLLKRFTNENQSYLEEENPFYETNSEKGNEDNTPVEPIKKTQAIVKRETNIESEKFLVEDEMTRTETLFRDALQTARSELIDENVPQTTNQIVESENNVEIQKNPRGKFQCPRCTFVHISKQCVNNHIKGRHEGVLWSCDICDDKFNSPYKIKNHKLKTHNNVLEKPKPQKTKQSTKEINSSDQSAKDESYKSTTDLINEDERREAEISKLKEEISLPANSYSIRKSTDEQEFDVYLEKNEKGKFKCNKCDREHSSKKAIMIHIQGRHMGIKWSCDICHKKISSPYHIKSHKRDEHNIVTETIPKFPNRKKRSCEVCGKQFYNISNLNRHKLVLHLDNETEKLGETQKVVEDREIIKNNDKFQCVKCKVEHISMNYMKNHILGKHKGKRWACKKCDKKFNNPYNCNTHQQRSHGLKTERRTLKSNGGFKEPKKHKLEMKKKISDRNTANRKLQGECKICNYKSFVDRGLWHHMKNKHEEKKWNCDLCVQKYVWRSGLRKHKEDVHNVPLSLVYSKENSM